jgi:predicted neuraminidase
MTAALALTTLALLAGLQPEPPGESPRFSAELVFPLHHQHNHAPSIAELAGGELIVSWYRGSGERTADDVAVYGARLKPGAAGWSEPFLLVDTPGFPDCNTCLMAGRDGGLWLFWPVILANSWESCLTHYLVASNPAGDGAPQWDRNGVILLRPDDFRDDALRILDEQIARLDRPLTDRQQASLEAVRERLGDKLY